VVQFGSRQKITNQNKAQQVKGKKISHLAEAVAFQYAERSPRGNAPAPMSARNIADQSRTCGQRNRPHALLWRSHQIRL